MKVTAILKGMIDSNGHQPIQIRIANGKQRTFKPTGIKVKPNLFEKGRVKKDHPKYRELNQELETKIIQYQVQALKGFKKRAADTDFFQYVRSHIKHLERTPATVRGYEAQLSKLSEFSSELTLQEINHSFLNRYKTFLKDRGNQSNTIWATFKFLKTFIRKAYLEKIIEDNPFDTYEAPVYRDPDMNYLTMQEVKKIEKFIQKPRPPLLMETAVWFLIACNTGLRISDIKAFDKKKNIVNGRLVVRTQKTSEIVGLPILPHVKKLFEKIDYQPLSIHENTYNHCLKAIAAVVGIDKRLHSHAARHTAGTLLADAGVTTDVIAKILGHSNTKYTQVYAKITNRRIDAEMKKIKR